MKYISVSIWWLIVIIVASCGKGKANQISKLGNCVFVQNDGDQDGSIDETEKTIMRECMKNALLSKQEIVDNLIGEWELVGYGHGWVRNISKPCGYIIITENELKLEIINSYIDTLTTHTWEIEEEVWQGVSTFYFKDTEEYIEGLSITTFCSDYMYGNGTPIDGNMYLYKKVK